jgi:hypothetical protein
MAEHAGAVDLVFIDPSEIALLGTAAMTGLRVIGSAWDEWQQLVGIGGPARLENCELITTATPGFCLVLLCAGRQPSVSHCYFHTSSGTQYAVRNFDSTDVYFPDNYFGRLDTAQIHGLMIEDGHDTPGIGYVTIAPVWDHFEWLDVPEREPRAPLPEVTTLELWPNPAARSVQLRLLSPTGVRDLRRVEIYDILGRLSSSIDVSPFQSTGLAVDLSAIPAGQYFVRAQSVSAVVTKSIIVIK